MVLPRVVVGAKVTLPVYIDSDKKDVMNGTICYIHPKKRFVVVAFPCENGHLIKRTYYFRGEREIVG